MEDEDLEFSDYGRDPRWKGVWIIVTPILGLGVWGVIGWWIFG